MSEKTRANVNVINRPSKELDRFFFCRGEKIRKATRLNGEKKISVTFGYAGGKVRT